MYANPFRNTKWKRMMIDEFIQNMKSNGHIASTLLISPFKMYVLMFSFFFCFMILTKPRT